MKRIDLQKQLPVYESVIDQKSQVSVKFFKDGEKYGFQYLKHDFNKEIDPFFHSKLDWFFGSWYTIQETEKIAHNYYFNVLAIAPI